MEHMVLVGGGLASTYAAAQLRSSGFTGKVTMLSEETHQPYDHVPLSKDYLYGGPGYHDLYLRTEDFYHDQQLELRLNTPVTALDLEARTLQLATGQTIGYDAVLLATGATARPLNIPGADTLNGVHYLRTLDQAKRLKQELHRSQHVVVIGAGWLGCEVAASAAMLGKEVTLISRGPLPLLSALGGKIATIYRDLHMEHGVEILTNAEAVALRGTQRAQQVVLHDGTVVNADTVVIAVGARPRTALAEQAGLDVHDGIVTDETMVTSRPGIFAAGDVASVWNPMTFQHVRRAHFNTARTQGKTAARSMLGEPVSYDAVPFFFSDQYEVWMECTGQARLEDELVVHGDVTTRRFVAFWLREGRLQAAMNMGLQGVPKLVRPLIRSGEALSDRRLRSIVEQSSRIAN